MSAALVLGVLVLGVSVLGTGAVPAAAASAKAAPVSPSASASAHTLLVRAIHDAQESSWVHETSRATAKGHRFSADNDIGTFEGRQVMVNDGQRAEVVQIGQQAYIRGNASAVADFFELTRNDPQQLADTWISVAPSDQSEYTTVIAAVTLKSDFADQMISGPVTEGHVVSVGGRRCIPIVGRDSTGGNSGPGGNSAGSAGKVTLYVSNTADPLPVERTETSPGGTLTTQWSRWNHPVSLRAPLDPVPFSSLFG